MPKFADIVDQNGIKRHFQKALKTGSFPHAYILSGEEGSGRHFISGVFAQSLVCTDLKTDERTGFIEPCCECSACRRAMEGSHPDIRVILPEKTAAIGVDDIRDKLGSDILKKPFEAPRRLYIIPDADRMTVQAQNAMLKTLEEPPEYVTIMLLAENPALFLQTVLSRSMLLQIRPASDGSLVRFLMEERHVVDYKARMAASFSSGNVGRAIRLTDNDSFDDLRHNTLELILRLERMNITVINEHIKDIVRDRNAEEKDSQAKTDPAAIQRFLDVCGYVFRDALVYKTGAGKKHLILSDESDDIGDISRKLSYAALSGLYKETLLAESRIKANVNAELILESLFLSIRERIAQG